MLRILTYNVHFGKRIHKIEAWLANQKNSDIICFQEFPQDSITTIRKTVSNTEYGYRFAPSLRKRKIQYGELTLFRKDRMRLIACTSLMLRTNSIDRYSMGRHSQRSCLITTFQLNRQRCVVVNLQLSCLATNALRYHQLQHIIQILRHHEGPRIIIGDFNMSSLLGRRKLFSLMKNNYYHTLEKYVATHRLLIVRHQLDYIFTRDCTIKHIDISRIRYSDHYPVTAMLEVRM